MPPRTDIPVRTMVFDLDGTLYVCPPFAAAIQQAAADWFAGRLSCGADEAHRRMAETRARLSEESGTTQTLSAVCAALGCSIKELHAHFENRLRPEAFLTRDERVIDLLRRLAGHFELFVYTNNNRALATRIISYLGLDGVFSGVFAIDDAWLAKPDEQAVRRVLEATGRTPGETLFVGDRYDVDLRVPEQLGCPVFLSQSIEQLLGLYRLLPTGPA